MIIVPVAAISAAYKQKEQNGFYENPTVSTTPQSIRYTVEIRKYFTFANYTMITGDYLRPPDFQPPAFAELTKIPGVSYTRVPSRTIGKVRLFNFVLDVGQSPIEYVKQNLDTFLSSDVWGNTEQEVIKMYLDWAKNEYEVNIDEDKLIYVPRIFYEIHTYTNEGKLVTLYSTGND